MAPPLACRQRPDAVAVTLCEARALGEQCVGRGLVRSLPRLCAFCLASFPLPSSQAARCVSRVRRPVRLFVMGFLLPPQSEGLIAAPRLFCERCGVAIRPPTILPMVALSSLGSR